MVMGLESARTVVMITDGECAELSTVQDDGATCWLERFESGGGEKGMAEVQASRLGCPFGRVGKTEGNLGCRD